MNHEELENEVLDLRYRVCELEDLLHNHELAIMSIIRKIYSNKEAEEFKRKP